MNEELRAAVTKLVAGHLLYDAEAIGPDDDLAALGLDSLAKVTLVVDLEQQLGIHLPDAMINESTLATIAAIVATVEPLWSGRLG